MAIIRHLLIILFILALPCLSWGNTDRLRVVMDDNYPPFIFRDSRGVLQGILVDQWQLWEQKTGVKVDLQAMDWAEAQRRMDAGEHDVIDTVFRTEARLKKYDFSRPYQQIDQPIYFKREISGIRDVNSLKGFTVAVKEGGAIIGFLKQHGINTLVTYPSYEAIIRAAKEGKVSVFSADQPPATYFLHKMGIVDRFKQTEPLNSGHFHRAVVKGNSATLKLVEDGFARITPEEYQKIEKAWYGAAAPPPSSSYQIVLIATAGLILLLALLLLWNWGLRKLVSRRTRELRESERNYRELVQSSNSIILRWKRDGTITFINDFGADFFGYTPEELLGKKVHDTLVPAGVTDGVDLQQMLADIFASPDRFHANQNQNCHRNGTRFWVSWSNSPLTDESGQVVEMLSVGTDTTARKEAEDALRHNQLELEHARRVAESANEAKSLFLANMSHEIRTPLNAIIGINSLLAERLEQRDLKELAKDSMAAANNLLDIISDVLDISKIEAGKLEIVQVPFDPRQIINQLERMFGTMIREKGLRFDVSLSSNLPGLLVSDPARLQQIGVNLLSNALKFTEQGGIRLILSGETRSEGDICLELTVRDTGKGILPENLERVFSPFEQEDLSTTRKYGGTGLGLAISKHLAEMLGGTITVTSTVGEGTSFTCLIPCTTTGAPANEAPVSVAVEQPARQQQLRILVAEDSVVNCKMMEAILRIEGHKVRFADNGRKAVEAWQQEQFDLILMDIQMPEMDGVQATAEIRQAETEQGGHIPIIALTAYAMSGDRERFLAAGMDGYLPKPITTDQLRRLLWEFSNPSPTSEQAPTSLPERR